MWNYQKNLSISKSILNSYIDEFEKEKKILNKEYHSLFKKISEKNIWVEKKDIKSLKKIKKILKEKLMKEFSIKEKLNKEDLKRILNNLD